MQCVLVHFNAKLTSKMEEIISVISYSGPSEGTEKWEGQNPKVGGRKLDFGRNSSIID